jgi:hypothetical protein
VNKKNKWDEVAKVFIQVKVWLKRSLGHSEGGLAGRRRVRVQEQASEGKGPQWRPVVREGCKDVTDPCRSEEEDSWDGRDLTIGFMRLTLIFKSVQKGFPTFA